jgi:Membrane bound FAD containing D-sorbitol dehydrogenase
VASQARWRREGKAKEETVIYFTRRKVLGVAAGTMASAIGTADLTEPAVADDAADLDLFVKLSAALTGIDALQLAPSVDAIQIKRAYFKQAKSDPGFEGLMQIVRANPADPVGAADKIMNSTDQKIKYLGRAIILAWYLGAWYQPTVLAQTPPPSLVTPLKVVSPTAYTQAWAWRVAQAHPMGYSELRFGYWSDEPLPVEDFVKAKGA